MGVDEISAQISENILIEKMLYLMKKVVENGNVENGIDNVRICNRI